MFTTIKTKFANFFLGYTNFLFNTKTHNRVVKKAY